MKRKVKKKDLVARIEFLERIVQGLRQTVAEMYPLVPNLDKQLITQTQRLDSLIEDVGKRPSTLLIREVQPRKSNLPPVTDVKLASKKPKAAGKHLPKADREQTRAKAIELRKQGQSVAAIASTLGISNATVYNYTN